MSTEGIKKKDSAKPDLAKSGAPADSPPAESSPGVAKGAVTAVDPRLVVREQGFMRLSDRVQAPHARR